MQQTARGHGYAGTNPGAVFMISTVSGKPPLRTGECSQLLL